ncbi:MAG: hypothetical protein AVDCRST_MAG69-634, partial [uncultured Solirubrobacteraceae bacterium]
HRRDRRHRAHGGAGRDHQAGGAARARVHPPRGRRRAAVGERRAAQGARRGRAQPVRARRHRL